MTDARDDCPCCGGEGTVIEFHRFAGEYQAGEPVEVECPDCDGAGTYHEEPKCACCEHPLDKNGWCSECREYAVERPELLPENRDRWVA